MEACESELESDLENLDDDCILNEMMESHEQISAREEETYN